MDLKRYDDVMNKAWCQSTGEVVQKGNGKWSFKMTLTALPMDILQTAEGPEFNTAIEAAQALFKAYGSEGWAE